MENGESNKETKSKHFKILSFVSMIVIVVIAIIRFIQNDINIQMSLGQKVQDRIKTISIEII